jgi:tryptophan synthase alpha chain
MQKIFATLENLRVKNQLGLMTHVVVGYPNLATTEKLVTAMAHAGANFIELQIPFSDPIADGPVILNANQKALDQKVQISDALKLMRRLSQKLNSTPLLFMTYYNILLHRGVEKFCRESKEAGASGLIVPDLPVEEAGEYLKACQKNKLAPIFVAAPNTPDARLKKIRRVVQGFFYVTARTGITGAQTRLSPETKKFFTHVKKNIPLPLAVGFGINSPAQIQALKNSPAAIAVVGSAVLRALEKGGVPAVERLVKNLKKAC